MTASKALRALREAIVLEVVEAENEHEFEAAVATFDHPRYEVATTGEVHDGRDEVLAHYARVREAFPERRTRVVRLHHADDALIIEGEVTGAEGSSALGMTAFFLFDGARLVGQRVYGTSVARLASATTG